MNKGLSKIKEEDIISSPKNIKEHVSTFLTLND